jgi:hypothetical protein
MSINETIPAIVELKSAEFANRVASHLFHVTAEENYLTFSNYDKNAFDFAVSFEKMSRIDYSFIDLLQVQFFDAAGFLHSFILHVESRCADAYPGDLSQGQIPKIYSESFTLGKNSQFTRFLEFLQPASDRWNIAIDVAVLTKVAKDNIISKYDLTLYGRERIDRIRFSPYKFRSMPYNENHP